MIKKNLLQHLNPKLTPKRILALDGGGIRGALSLGYLQRIEDILRQQHGNDSEFRLCDYFDLIGGTSTGSIIAACLSSGMKVNEISKMYKDLGEDIFGKTYKWWTIVDIDERIKAKYNSKPLEEQLQKLFSDQTLGDNKIKTGLCIVSKRADTNSTWLFNNNPGGQFYDSKDGRNNKIPLWQLIRSSTAAPTYFFPELLKVGNKITGAFIDGGVSMANNPSLELFKMVMMNGFRFNWQSGADNLLLISVGTGNAEYFSKTKQITKKWLLKWAKEIPDMLMSDASWNNQTMLQWISKCPKPRKIDMEIGDLKNECLTEKPLLTYLRYNQVISVEELNKLGLNHKFIEKDVKSLKEMSKAKNCKLLFEIGDAAAKKEIDPSDFPDNFKIK